MLDQSKRLTARRVNGIKSGYWSPCKKDDLVARLAEYEDAGFTPEEIAALANGRDGPELWTDPEEQLPAYGRTVLVARVKDPNLPPIVEQATRCPGDWWKVYGANVKRILAWRPMPQAPEEFICRH